MNPYQLHEAEIIERIQESDDLFTLRLKFTDESMHENYFFKAGQFNMLYLYGVGEIPISIVSDPKDKHILDHTIRIVGRVTRGMAQLQQGEKIGIRGPYGRGWPVEQAEGKDVVVVTGGLGCAPVVSVITYIEHRRNRFGKMNIVQGVKHSNDLIWKDKYDHWREMQDTKVLLAADEGDALWPHHVGLVTSLFDDMEYDKENCVVMMCGPEGMMRAASHDLIEGGVSANNIYVSMERNMQCAVGHCGHCQYGDKFICKDGPVFSYPEIQHLFAVRGF